MPDPIYTSLRPLPPNLPRGIRVLVMGRYYNSHGHAVAIVAAITVGLDWAAYIGRADPTREEEAYPYVAAHGDKLRESDARHFFPDITERYRS